MNPVHNSKMNPFVEKVLKDFFDNNNIFENKSEFVRFKCEPATALDSSESTSTIIRGRICYTRQNGDQSLSPLLFLKLKPNIGKFTEGLPILFCNEMFFYSQVLPFFTSLEAPTASTLFAKFYEGLIKTSSQVSEAVLILEHLDGSKYKNAARRSFLDYSHLSLMAKRLGRFHAYSYLAKQMHPVNFFAYAHSLNPIHFTTLGKCRGFLTRTGGRGVDKLSLQDEYKDNIPAIQQLLDNADELMVELFKGQRYNKLSVICHGDYISGNILFQYDGEHPVDLKMVDLAYSTFSSPILDLALVLYVNADQKMRDTHWNQIIDDYFDGLSSLPISTNCLPAKEDILGEFQRKAFFAYQVASYFLPHLVAEDHNLERFQNVMPKEYIDWPLDDIPVEILGQVYNTVGGEIGTKVLTDILKDMLKRGFI